MKLNLIEQVFCLTPYQRLSSASPCTAYVPPYRSQIDVKIPDTKTTREARDKGRYCQASTGCMATAKRWSKQHALLVKHSQKPYGMHADTQNAFPRCMIRTTILSRLFCSAPHHHLIALSCAASAHVSSHTLCVHLLRLCSLPCK